MSRIVIRYPFVKICLIAMLSCNAPTRNISAKQNVVVDNQSGEHELIQEVNYIFAIPTETFVLNRKLREISGLGYNADDDSYLAINDESGVIYMLDGNKFDIQKEIKFGKRGDYEAIEKVDENMIVCKSTGTLYFYNLSTEKTIKYDTDLKRVNNVEGLCYSKEYNSLLLACKGSPVERNRLKKNIKCIYSFDLDDRMLDLRPFIKIENDTLLTKLKEQYGNEPVHTMNNMVKKIKEFSPSGIAIHPHTGDYYIISARGSSIVTLDKNKVINKIVFLNDRTIPQPEGITFDGDKNLYISTEGQGYSGKIYKYKYNG